jgi:hypothetical protein
VVPVSRIYVASSWRNAVQPQVVADLRSAGHEVYDFKNPRAGEHGFHWSEVGMPSYDRATNGGVPVHEYLAGIRHPVALAGFDSDFRAMEWADRCVLVLPCGRSAHLEAGWFVGAGLRVAILLDGPLVTPELMYLMADRVLATVGEVVEWAGRP